MNNLTTQRIIYLFEKSGKSARSILKDLELSSTALNEWKKGKSNPTAKAINKIANYFNVSTDFIYGRTNEEQPTYPNLYLTNNQFEMSFWFNEKIDKVLSETAKLVNIIKNTNLSKEKYNEMEQNLDVIIFNAVKIIGATTGITNNEYFKDYKMILEKGSIGYEEFKTKYNIKTNDLKNLIYKEK